MRRAVLSVGILGLLLASATCQPMRTFTHPTLGFKIDAPAAWKPDTSDPEVAVAFETPEESSFYLAVTTAPMPATFCLRERLPPSRRWLLVRILL
jgi:predicted Zn-dependent protease